MSEATVQYPLNDYQQLMHLFCEEGPYNAVHFIRLPDKLDDGKLLNSIQTIIDEIGLGKPHFDSSNTIVSFREKCAVPLPKREIALVEHAYQEINRPFKDTAFPLRFFLVKDNTSLYLSITYNHWLCDGSATSELAMTILDHYTKAKHTRLSLTPPPLKDCFSPLKRFKFLRTLGIMRRNIFLFAKAYRPALNIKAKEVKTHLHFHLFDENTLPRLKAVSKDYEVSVNDIFIAVLARVMGRLADAKTKTLKRKPFKPKRDNILISVICDIKSYSTSPLKQYLNLFLGGYSLAFKAPHDMSIRKLLHLTRKETKRLKKKKIAVKSMLTFDFLKRQWKKHANKFKLFHQKMPITVGISNMNLGLSSRPHLKEADYFRFSPSSAMCPLVFSMTHFNHTLSLSIAATNNRYEAHTLSGLNEAFIQELDALFDSVGV